MADEIKMYRRLLPLGHEQAMHVDGLKDGDHGEHELRQVEEIKPQQRRHLAQSSIGRLDVGDGDEESNEQHRLAVTGVLLGMHEELCTRLVGK